MIAGEALAGPLHDLLGTFGATTWAGVDHGAALRAGADVTEEVRGSCGCALAELSWDWTGPAAEAAFASGQRLLTDTVEAVDRGLALAGATVDATATVVTGAAELHGLVDSFTSFAHGLGPTTSTPQGQIALLVTAIEHIAAGVDTVTRVLDRLTDITAQVQALIPPPVLPDPAGSGAAGPGSVGYEPTPDRGPADGPTGAGFSSSLTFGANTGLHVALPDGSVAVAPNPTAAEAVRRALEQQGTPYEWGGTNPGRGLDCSGLTQWAYREAGMDIPRLAQNQGVGTRIDPGSVMPGDLAVWDGHVAMIVGNGMMIEAGDPVSVGPVRTTNSGMGFMGFYRPTSS